jgi:hypothetical protein
MSRFTKVINYENLARDNNSKAIVNTNVSEFQSYLNRKRAQNKERDQIRSAIREINNLKQELYEIKNLIKDCLGKKDGN